MNSISRTYEKVPVKTPCAINRKTEMDCCQCTQKYLLSELGLNPSEISISKKEIATIYL
jgi:hypothetical protein